MRLLVTIRPNSSAATATLSIGAVEADCTIIRDDDVDEDDDIVIMGRRAS
jgi:hypothetical protein